MPKPTSATLLHSHALPPKWEEFKAACVAAGTEPSSYTVVISEQQRAWIERALHIFSVSTADIMHSDAHDELDMLCDMVAQLPSIEDTHYLTHGLCV